MQQLSEFIEYARKSFGVIIKPEGTKENCYSYDRLFGKLPEEEHKPDEDLERIKRGEGLRNCNAYSDCSIGLRKRSQT